MTQDSNVINVSYNIGAQRLMVKKKHNCQTAPGPPSFMQPSIDIKFSEDGAITIRHTLSL